MKNSYLSILDIMLIMSLLTGKSAQAVETSLEQETVKALTQFVASSADSVFGVEANQGSGQSNGSNSRRGTENWEQPQSNFFVIPGLVIAVAAIAYFFTRKE